MSLTSILPSPKQHVLTPRSIEIANKNKENQKAIISKKKIPPYGSRKGWIPRSLEDFGDGGSFPEIHIAQHPLNMGKESSYNKQKTIPITLDSQGKIKFDAIINPGGVKNMQTKYQDLVAVKVEEDELKRPDPEVEAEVAEKTRKSLEAIVNVKIQAAQPSNPGGVLSKNEPTYIRYTPAQQLNTGISQRIIRLTEAPVDPLEPPKFKHKKVPRGPPSPPVPVMHSPPRKVTVKDQQEWKIPPCISNWKNNKGYTIPLDKRLAADGRGLQDVQINDNFAKLSEALYIAERNAREEVAKRAEIEKRLKIKEKEQKEEQLRRMAQEIRMQREIDSLTATEDDKEAMQRRERDEIREERRKEIERNLRIQKKKSTVSRNADRDVSEKIALGQEIPTQNSETMFDQRLFNQTEGLSSGFGDDESYNIYTKPLFQGSSANMIYRPKKGDEDTYGGEEDFKKLLDTSKFRPDKDFSGVDRSKPIEPRDKPVEFEKEEEDPFGLNDFLNEAKISSKKNALDKIGTQGHMHASSGNTNTNSSKRSRIAFESEKGEKNNSDRKDKQKSSRK